jgi:hypothetical protein
MEDPREKFSPKYNIFHKDINIIVDLVEMENIWYHVLQDGLEHEQFNIFDSYIKLLKLETLQFWKGKFFKKPKFCSHPRIKNFFNSINLKPNTNLCYALNSDDNLLLALRNSDINNVEIVLSDFKEFNSLDEVKDFCLNLDSIKWNIKASLTILKDNQLFDFDNSGLRLSESQEILKYICNVVIKTTYKELIDKKI